MNRVMVNSAYRIILETDLDITLAAPLNIVYKRPDGVEVTVAAAILSPREIYYDMPAATNSTAGRWLFRASFTLGATVYIGETRHLQVWPAWTPFSGE